MTAREDERPSPAASASPDRRFPPAEWDRSYDEASSPAAAYVFRRSGEIALRLVLEHHRPGMRWVDLGCGTGRVTTALAGRGVPVLGLDRDAAMLRFARGRAEPGAAGGARDGAGAAAQGAEDAGASPAGAAPDWAAARVQDLPFADGTVDGLVAVSLAGCLDAPLDFFTEAHRVLSPGGVAVVTFTNGASRLLRLNYFRLNGGRSSDPARPQPDVYRLFRADLVRADLERTGFRVRQVLHYNFVLHAGRRLIPPRRVALALDRLGRRGGAGWARNFVVVATKRARDAALRSEET